MANITDFPTVSTLAAGDFLVGHNAADTQELRIDAGDLQKILIKLAVTPQTLTDGANIAYNVANGLKAKVTLAGNRTLDALTNVSDGHSGALTIIQDATGSRGLALDASYVVVSGAAADIASQGANKRSFLAWEHDAGSAKTYVWITHEP